MQAKTGQQQGQVGNFTVNATVNDIFSSKRSAEVKAAINHLPVVGIDALFSVVNPKMKGLLTEALGPSLDLKLTSNLSKHNLLIDLQMDSPNIHAVFTSNTSDNEVFISEPAKIDFTATPAFFLKLSEFYLFLKKYSLEKPTELTVIASSTFLSSRTFDRHVQIILGCHYRYGTNQFCY